MSFLHVDEASIHQVLLLVQGLIQALAELLARLIEELQDLLGVRRVVDSIVVRSDRHFVLLHFDPPAGLQVRVNLSAETLPVSDTASHAATADEIKRFARPVRPLALDIVDVELAPGRHPARLDGAEIRADDFGAGELVGKVDGPDAGAGAGAKVEDALRLSDDGCPEEAAVEQETEDVVQEIEAVLLLLIVGQYVLSLPSKYFRKNPPTPRYVHFMIS